jgi:hypothetical protein
LNAYIGLFAILLLASPLTHGAKQNPTPAMSSCGVVEQALSATKQISVGKHRRDVERLFERDGGMLSPSATRYTYSQCRFLHIDVEFEAAKNEHPFSADDTVINVSRLYVEYPAKD